MALIPETPYYVPETAQASPFLREEGTAQQMLQAREASLALPELQKQIQQQEALRQFQGPEARQHGSVYTAANPLEFLGSMLNSGVAGGKADRLTTQAQALRGEAAAGEMAAAEDAFAQQQHAAEQEQAMLAQKQQAQAYRDEYMKKEGKTEEELERDYFNEAMERMPNSLEKEFSSNRNLVQQLNSVVTKARNLTAQDREDLNQAFTSAMLDFSPKEMKGYLSNNILGLSSEAKDYLETVYSTAAGKRHSLSGAALSRYEGALFDSFAPSAEGVTFEDRMRRIDRMGDELTDSIQNISSLYNIPTPYRGVSPYQGWITHDVTPPTTEESSAGVPAPASAPAPAPASGGALTYEQKLQLAREKGLIK